jgi:hypothetical protein
MNGTSKSTNETSFIRNALIFLDNAKAFIMNGTSKSRNGLSFLSNALIFLCNERTFLTNGNPNLTNAYPYLVGASLPVGSPNVLHRFVGFRYGSIPFLPIYFSFSELSPLSPLSSLSPLSLIKTICATLGCSLRLRSTQPTFFLNRAVLRRSILPTKQRLTQRYPLRN